MEHGWDGLAEAKRGFERILIASLYMDWSGLLAGSRKTGMKTLFSQKTRKTQKRIAWQGLIAFATKKERY